MTTLTPGTREEIGDLIVAKLRYSRVLSHSSVFLLARTVNRDLNVHQLESILDSLIEAELIRVIEMPHGGQLYKLSRSATELQALKSAGEDRRRKRKRKSVSNQVPAGALDDRMTREARAFIHSFAKLQTRADKALGSGGNAAMARALNDSMSLLQKADQILQTLGA